MAVEKKETGKAVETKAPAAKAPVAKAAEAPKAAAPAAKAEEPKAAAPAAKAAPKAAAEKKPAAKKETVKKDTVKKTAAPKKETVKKAPAAKKEEPAAKVVIEYAGKSIVAKDVLDAATKAYTESHKGVAIKNIDIYVKPEENVAYYVVNGEGSDDFRVEL